jgi:hypothetical protein
MDFSKLTAQRAAKEQTGPAPTATAKVKTQGSSKRQGWKAATFYIRPETLAQLRRVVALRKIEGSSGDLSDAVEEALQAWLSNQDQT